MKLQLDKIPEELKTYKQWVCWKYEKTDNDKLTKVPYNPKTGYKASPTDFSSWSSFADIVNYVNDYDGIGFALSINDPYAFIDMDSTVISEEISLERNIFNSFDSYTEVSPSGRGAHIIVKGSVIKGRRRDPIEMYSSSRFMTVTGNVLHDKPIMNRQDLCLELWEYLGKKTGVNPAHDTDLVSVYSVKSGKTDDEIYRSAYGAQNGQKFIDLFNGEWANYYKSQSEADLTLINILAFYTKDSEQIYRMFAKSALGQRDKAKRPDYIMRMINMAYDRELPQFDFESMRARVSAEIVEKEKQKDEQLTKNEFLGKLETNNHYSVVKKQPTQLMSFDDACPYKFPSGILGNLANYIHNSSVRPSREIALASAMGLMAGICGRAWNIEGSGLNQYIVVLADTGVGKGELSAGIDRTINNLRHFVPDCKNFVGPGTIASGQGLGRILMEKNSFVSVVGEFGDKFAELSQKRLTEAQSSFKRMLQDLYNKSAHGQIWRGSAYSDVKKSIPDMKSPSFSILAESQPSEFFKNLDETVIKSGILPRFSIIQGPRFRPPRNLYHTQYRFPDDLRDAMVALISTAVRLNEADRVIDVQFDVAAYQAQLQFDIDTDNLINANKINSVAVELWNRAHFKLLKISALVAVGINPFNPIITLECIEFAKSVINLETSKIIQAFERGEVGDVKNDEIDQRSKMLATVREYLVDTETQQAYKIDRKMWDDKVIPMSYLSRRLNNVACFRNDRMGGIYSIKRTIQQLVEDGELLEIHKDELFKRYGKTGRCFAIMNLDSLYY